MSKQVVLITGALTGIGKATGAWWRLSSTLIHCCDLSNSGGKHSMKLAGSSGESWPARSCCPYPRPSRGRRQQGTADAGLAQ